MKLLIKTQERSRRLEAIAKEIGAYTPNVIDREIVEKDVVIARFDNLITDLELI